MTYTIEFEKAGYAFVHTVTDINSRLSTGWFVAALEPLVKTVQGEYSTYTRLIGIRVVLERK